MKATTKATTKCYVPVSVEDELPRIDELGIFIKKDGNAVSNSRDNEFGISNSYTHWLKPQELITFTKEEWSEQERELKSWIDGHEDKTRIGLKMDALLVEKDKEIERLKDLISKAHRRGFNSGSPEPHYKVAQETAAWQQFKTDNNL